MPGNLLRGLTDINSGNLQNNPVRYIIIPILHIKKLQHRKTAQTHSDLSGCQD